MNDGRIKKYPIAIKGPLIKEAPFGNLFISAVNKLIEIARSEEKCE